ncbi:hypothetical protein ACIHDR_43165 [Nocardia sp. NPDC052278]|uniref:hypothetical protein n=1 Tax=unclassified Nocardia TaxID=2637762 RepID=UPI0036833CCD
MREPRELPISGRLADLLDEFLRNKELPARELFTEFLAARGSKHPAFDAANLIDELGFTVLRFRRHNERDR